MDPSNQSSGTAQRQLLSRRGFIRIAAGGAIAGAVGLPVLLSACGGANSGPSGAPAASGPASGSAAAKGKAGSALPTYVASSGGPKPDFHNAGDPRVTDGFINYPKDPVKALSTAPGTGSTINVLIPAYYPPPAPYDQNPTWKEVNKQLNANVQMNIVPPADYNTRLATIMAGNDLPDTMHMIGGIAGSAISPGFPLEFLQKACADLTPYLGGDAAKEYPYLAAIPTFAWKNSGAMANGSLWAIPIQRYQPAWPFFKNNEMWDQELGANYVPKDAADFKKALQQLNQPKNNRYAIGNYSAPIQFGLNGFAQMFGAPNGWKLDSGGKLIKDHETDEYKQAVSYLKDLLASGLYPPDIATATDSRSAFISGRFAVSVEAFGNGWSDFWRRGMQHKPAYKFDIIQPFAAQAGQKPVHFLTGGLVAANVIKKGSPDRIKEILRVLNWLAAPFGTQEDMLLSYGLKGSDYTLDANNNPLPTKDGLSHSGYVPWRYIAQHPFVWYQPDLPGFAEDAFKTEQSLLKVGISDPTFGYRSPTNTTKGVAANRSLNDGVNDILFNRRPFSDYDGLVKTWVSQVGDQIRKEYTEAIAAEK